MLRLESPQGTIQYGLRREVLEGEIEEPEELFRQIDAVTAEDVQRVARDLLEGKRLYLAVVGPFDDPERFEKLIALRERRSRELLRRTAEIAAEFLESLDERPVWPPASVEELRRLSEAPCRTSRASRSR